MVKTVLLSTFLCISTYAQILDKENHTSLEEACLSCHKKQQIPNQLIYRRYLMRYSTTSQMQKAIVKYLKNPHIQYTIMPSQFFLKFPMKKAVVREDEVLKELVKAYLDKFDIKKMLVLPKR